MRTMWLAVLAACGGGSSTATPPTTTPTPMAPGTSVTTPGVVNAPEISSSLGEEGGIVVLWPRVRGTDASSREIAGQIQARLVEIAKRTGKPVDVRPEPQRACPRSGCKAIALGAALLRNGDACAVIATVSAAGPSEATIVPWVGDMILKSPVAAFREPPESQVQVKDYTLCTSVTGELGPREKDVDAALGSL